jgi:4-hydroxybenzoate polyprenyltransferase
MFKWRAYFELLRLPAVFTAIADVIMGYLVTHGELRPLAHSGLLILSSALIYLAGMVLNDVNDVDIDAIERPQRPIPSGRIPLASAKRLGWGLLISGVIAAWIAALITRSPWPVPVGTALAVCVYLYDSVFKWTPLAPVLMASCRFLNVMLGMSLVTSEVWPNAPRWWHTYECLIAVGVGIYIFGLTCFARTEARSSNRARLLASAAIMLIGILALGTSATFYKPRSIKFITEQDTWPIIWLSIAGVFLTCLSPALIDPSPQKVQRAVRIALRFLILLDALLVLGWIGPLWAGAVLLLFVPMFMLERRFSTT